MTLVAADKRAFVVTSELRGERVDVFVRDRLGVGRRDVWDLIKGGGVVVMRNKKLVRGLRKSEPLQLGDEVEVDLGLLARAEPDPTATPPILFESEHVVVCEKAPGLPSGALRDARSHNLASGLLARYPEMAEIGHNRLEPGLVHRLDTWTSGLLVAARTELGFACMKKALERGTFTKEYLAVVALGSSVSALDVGTELMIESDLGPHPTDPSRVSWREGHRYRTEAVVLKTTETRALLKVRVVRAYRHQIRIHLAELGFPLVGDSTYGSPDLEGTPRHALHAHYVASSEAPTFRVRSTLPPDLAALIGGFFESPAPSS